MSSIKVNVYYKSKDIIAESFFVESYSSKSIEDARFSITKSLDNIYSDVKYKVTIHKPFYGNEYIEVVFEENIAISRHIKLRDLLL
jgi:hypothetical protein